MFQFGIFRNRIPVRLRHRVFYIDAMAVCAGVQKMQEKINALLDTMQEEAVDAFFVERACATVCACIDDILGHGAAVQIFRGKTVSFFDCLDVYYLLQKKVNRFMRRKFLAYQETENASIYGGVQ